MWLLNIDEITCKLVYISTLLLSLNFLDNLMELIFWLLIITILLYFFDMSDLCESELHNTLYRLLVYIISFLFFQLTGMYILSFFFVLILLIILPILFYFS